VNTHELKSYPQFFEAVLDGSKPFEIRKNDRSYAVGDRLILCEWIPASETYTGNSVSRVVTYLTAFAQMPGWVVLGLSRD
jgi:hypothetical protein